MAVILALIPGCGRPEWAAELEPVPVLDLSPFEPVVREQLEKALERVAAALRVGDRDETAEAYGALGGMFHTYELYAAATICLENALRLEPDELRWNYYLAIVQHTAGALAQAVGHLERAIELAPDYLPARVRLGELWITSRRPEAARKELETALELDPDCALAHYFLGKASLALSESEAAIEHFERSLALQPQATAVHHLLAQAHRERGDLEQAQRHLGQRGDTVVTIRDPLFLELGEFDLGAAARIRRGAQAQIAGDYDTALEEYRQAVAADPENPEARQSLGGVLVRKGETRAAIEQYRVALRLLGEDPLVLSNLGAVLMAQGENAEALQMLERAIVLDPTLRNARLALGTLLTDESRPSEALAHYRAVLERDRDNADALLGLAQALAATGDSAGAVSALETALASTSPPETRARIHAELGSMLARTQDALEALARFDAAIELDPQLTFARFARANLLGALGRFREAGAGYSDVIRLAPGSVPARLGGATAWAMAGDYARARDCLQAGLGEATDPQLDHALARLLVTAPDERVRDPTRGLALAQSVHRRVAAMETGETLALALAAAGSCAKAVEQERLLLGQAERVGNRGLVDRVGGRLSHFERTGSCLPPWAA
ncbi:MAG: tetratricopeptide repeat protein [Acidobacteria bacterium]|nr:tetratricopeptide repeat protein [Acidobacteriota bacterium]